MIAWLNAQPWLLAALCLMTAATLLAYWRLRAPWTPWWPLALPLVYLGSLYLAIQFGALPDIPPRAGHVRTGLALLALSILFATLTSWRHRSH
jgi:hypothetical protein